MTIDLGTLLIVVAGIVVVHAVGLVEGVIIAALFIKRAVAPTLPSAPVVPRPVPLPIPVPPAPIPAPAPPQPDRPPPLVLPAHSRPFTGKMSTFGGPNDTKGVSSIEGLALVEPSEMHKFPGMFLAEQPPGTTGLARRLDPDAFYCACKWNYKETPRSFLQTIMVQVTNAAGKSIMVRPVDEGPNDRLDRVIDLSPGAAKALGLQTDDTVTVLMPLPAGTAVVHTTAGPAVVTGEPPWLTIARAEIGFHELPDNHGIQRYVNGTNPDGTHTMNPVTGQPYPGAGYGADGEPWCAIFAGAMLRAAGIDITGCTAMARSYSTAPSMTKIDSPRLGCIVVYWRGSKIGTEGHVGLYISDDGTRIQTLGGNENDQVEIEGIPMNGSTMGVLGYYWPAATATEPKLS